MIIYQRTVLFKSTTVERFQFVRYESIESFKKYYFYADRHNLILEDA